MIAKEKRGVEDARTVCWKLIDLCETMLNDKKVDDKAKQTWARILAQSLRTLIDILQEAPEDVKQDLAKILDQIPKKYREMIENGKL